MAADDIIIRNLNSWPIVIPRASPNGPGLMTPADRAKLDGLGLDAPLSDLTPAPTGAASAGVAAVASRGDHVHAHGDHSGGSLHAVAVSGGAAGFVSGADKAKLDGILPGAGTGVFNVKSYGAVGDGATNDSAAFSAAFAAAMAVSGTVYAPRGTYRLASIVNIANGGGDVDLRLVGDGPSSVLLPDCAGQIYCLGFTNFRRVEIGWLRVNGAGRQSARSADSFVLNLVNSNVFIHDVRFDNLLTAKSAVSTYEGVVSNYGGASPYGGGRLRLDRVVIAASCDVGTANDHSYVCNLSQSGFGFKGFEANDCWMQEQFTPTETAAHCVFFGDIVTHGLNDSDFAGAGAYNGLIPVDYQTNADDGAVVSAHRFVYDSDAIRMVNVRMCGQVRDAHLKFSPVNARYQWIYLDGCQFGSSDYYHGDNIAIRQADYVEMIRCWSGIGGAFHASPCVALTDAGHVVIVHSRFEGDDLYRPPNVGHARITADAATKSLRLRDVFYKEIDVSCPCVVEKDGVTGRLRGTTTEEIPAYVLVKLGSGGEIAPLGTADAAYACVGVAQEPTRRAYGYVIFNAAFDITESDTFDLQDGVNAAKAVTFTLVGTAGRVSVSNGMTSDQRATALADWINTEHGAGFQITATAVGGGTGRVKLVNDNVGYVGNEWPVHWDGNQFAGKQSAVTGAIVALGPGEGAENVPVADFGQETLVRSDGTEALAPGDIVSPSVTTAGRIRKSTADPIGVVVVGCAATPDAVARVLLR